MAEQELKWWHVRWRPAARGLSRFAVVAGKVLGGVCLIGAVGYGVVYLLAPWLGAHRFSRFDPLVNVLPTELPGKLEASLSGPTIDCRGFTLRLPELVGRAIQGDSRTLAFLANKGILECHDGARDPGMFEFMIRDKQVQKMLGQETVRSKFSVMRAAMWSTPGEVKWWRLRSSANKRSWALVEIKSVASWPTISFHEFTGPIYTIDSGGWRGFQEGNPEVAPYEVHLDLFDAADRHFSFDVAGREGHGRVVTQAEVNAMVASVRATADR